MFAAEGGNEPGVVQWSFSKVHFQPYAAGACSGPCWARAEAAHPRGAWRGALCSASCSLPWCSPRPLWPAMAARFSPEVSCPACVSAERTEHERCRAFKGKIIFSPLTNAGGIIPATELLAQTVWRTKKYRSNRDTAVVDLFLSLLKPLPPRWDLPLGTENLGQHGGARSAVPGCTAREDAGCSPGPPGHGALPLAIPPTPNPTNSVPPRAWRRLGKAAGAAAPSHCLL